MTWAPPLSLLHRGGNGAGFRSGQPNSHLLTCKHSVPPPPHANIWHRSFLSFFQVLTKMESDYHLTLSIHDLLWWIRFAGFLTLLYGTCDFPGIWCSLRPQVLNPHASGTSGCKDEDKKGLREEVVCGREQPPGGSTGGLEQHGPGNNNGLALGWEKYLLQWNSSRTEKWLNDVTFNSGSQF